MHDIVKANNGSK